MQSPDQRHSPTIIHTTLTAKPHAFAGAVLSPKHAKELTPSVCLAIASALVDQSHRKSSVPYTLWITEAWRVLGWAEPSAALFWELATMFHTLYLAAAEYQDGMINQGIPPILSCGSTSSLGSGMTNDNHAATNTSRNDFLHRKKFSTVASAKELPVWLIGTFLLLHCEDFAIQRSLSGQDDRRFFGDGSSLGFTSTSRIKFPALFQHSSLSPRARLHAGLWGHDNIHCTTYLLRHLRKFLLLTAVSHNPEAMRATMHLASIPSPVPSISHPTRAKYSTDELRLLHDDEHGNVGLEVHLTMEDLDRLHFTLQPPQGGGIDDSPLKMGEFLFQSLYNTPPPPIADIEIPLLEVEHEIRRQLELEMLMADTEVADPDDKDTDVDENAVASTSSSLAKLSLSTAKSASNCEGDSASQLRAKQPHNQYQKELCYTHYRGTTILLKPNPVDVTSSGASSASGAGTGENIAASTSGGRLHDLAISDCSDAHFYLLQSFEHATICACTSCTIVVGAVAGLLYVVDCEKTNITTASRRVLVSNSVDVQLFVFTPTPPLLVGDNRSVQFAPYNTYYDGLREDLLATALAAAVNPESQSPYHGGGSGGGGSNSVGGGVTGRGLLDNPGDAAWPILQCASNKWKQPIELSKLEVPHVPAASNSTSPTSGSTSPLPGALSVGADDKAMNKNDGTNVSMMSSILMPASDFHILFVPVESDAARQRRLEMQEMEDSTGPMESQYCVLLAEILQLSPFRLPVEFERRVLVKAERMRLIQQLVKKNLNEEQQQRFEEELNRGFREWLVQSGNLRQVLDLVHLERRGGT